jgi:hypothetical protein
MTESERQTQYQAQYEEKVLREDARKQELLWAMRTRVLTDAEMGEVGQYAEMLFVYMGSVGMGAFSTTSYNQKDLEQRLNAMLLQQCRLRALLQKEETEPPAANATLDNIREVARKHGWDGTGFLSAWIDRHLTPQKEGGYV